MRILEVLLNGKRQCDAGVGDDGAVTAIVMSVSRRGEVANGKNSRRVKDDLRLDIAGFYSPTGENVGWHCRKLWLGDEVRIRIGEARLASKPSRRERADPALAAKAEEKYPENTARGLGWTILKPRRSHAR
jgi:hypothetical protein